jgi:hypothetical protein
MHFAEQANSPTASGEVEKFRYDDESVKIHRWIGPRKCNNVRRIATISPC